MKPPSSSGSDRPAQAQRTAGKPVPRRASSLSRESAFIGYLVLGFGILAVVAVVLLLMGRDNVSNQAQAPKTPVQQNAAHSLPASPTSDAAGNTTAAQLRRDLNAMPQTAAVPSEPEPALAFSRGGAIDKDDLSGGWQAMIGDRLAVMQMEKGAFQIILAPADPTFPRSYSSGTYDVLEDMVILNPRLDWAAPKVPEGSGIRYERLTAGSYPMIVAFKGGEMFWQPVPATETRIYVPLTNPLLVGTQQRFISWKKL